jgi:protein glucosyltransferase
MTDGWFESPRVRLSLLSLKMPDLLDARFTYMTQLPLDYQSLIKKMLPMAPFLSPPEHLGFKYLICMDGNTSSYPGLHWRLLSNSAVMKQESHYIQWYYRGLVPYREFFPIKADLSNLKESIEYLKAHDEIAEQIAKSGQEFAEKNLSIDACYYYLDKVLLEYTKTFFPKEYELFAKDLPRSSALKPL